MLECKRQTAKASLKLCPDQTGYSNLLVALEESLAKASSLIYLAASSLICLWIEIHGATRLHARGAPSPWFRDASLRRGGWLGVPVRGGGVSGGRCGVGSSCGGAAPTADPRSAADRARVAPRTAERGVITELSCSVVRCAEGLTSA
eukprot:scaffold98808_cov69-Phaeocystis_antarctica.AAC.9